MKVLLSFLIKDKKKLQVYFINSIKKIHVFENYRTIDSLAVGYGKGRLACFLGDPESTIDVVGSLNKFNSYLFCSVMHN